MAFNPSLSFRKPTFRSQPSIRSVPETFEPLSEIKETPEAYLLNVYLPGFTKDLFKIALMDSSRNVRITGERPFAPNKLRRFDKTYPIPENSEAETLEAKFEQGTLILKIQKKSQVPPKQEVGKTLEKSAQVPLDKSKHEKVQETIPPLQFTTSTKLEEPTKDMKSDSPQTQSLEKMTQKDTHDDTSSQIPQQTIVNNDPQKGQQEFEPKPTTSIDTTKTQIDEKPQKGQEEFEPKPTFIERIKSQINEKAQKGQEEFEPKPTFIERIKTKINEEAQKGQEELEPKRTAIEKTKTQIDEKPQNDQEEFEPKHTFIERIETKPEEIPQDLSNNKHLDATKPEKVQETIPPPQSTTETKLEEPTKDMKSDSLPTQSLEEKTQKDTHNYDTSSQIPQQTITNNNPQKDQQEIEPKPTTSIDTTKKQKDEKPQKSQEEFEPKPTFIERIKTKINERVQKGQEEFEPKPTFIERIKSKINEKAQKGQEELVPKRTAIEKTKTQTDEKPSKDQKKIEPKPKVTFITKEKLEENIVGTSAAEDSEKEKISKKEIEEKDEMPYDSSKTMKDVKNEIEKAEPSVPQVTETVKESCCRVSPNQEGKNGIGKLASASSQFVTRIGAAVLVIAAIGAYVSYWFSS